jgi:hypothetical protein
MKGTIYLTGDDGQLLPMVEQPYDSEAVLQRLLASHPALLAGEQMTDGSPRRWLLIGREVAIAPQDAAAPWYVDHVYLDQDGVLTLVEVKRSTDPRGRREVVGQMLDYAANASTRWSIESLRARLASDSGSDERLLEFLDGANLDDFWQSVATNLAAGRIRMVFVADAIPPELRTIVDFLASQFRNAEAYAVEVRNFQGQRHQALVPRLVSTPKPAATTVSGRQWDEPSFFDELARRYPEKAGVARRLYTWASCNMTDFWFGKGSTAGSCVPRLVLPTGRLLLFAMWTSGTIELYFKYMRISPFAEEARRRELAYRLAAIGGLVLPPDAHNRLPSIDMALLQADEQFRKFIDAMEWAINQVRSFSNPHDPVPPVHPPRDREEQPDVGE